MTGVSLERLADTLYPKPEPKNSTAYGTVESINPDGSYQVKLNASATTTRCAKLCDAEVTDRVLVLIQANGHCAAIGRVGGSIPSKDVDWTQSTYANGYYMRRGKMASVVCESFGSITAPNNNYATVFTLPEGFRPVLPTGKSLYGAASTLGGAYPVAWKIESDGKVSVGGCGTSPNYWAFNATFPCE